MTFGRNIQRNRVCMSQFSCRSACYHAVKLRTKNNTCMLCASVSCWALLFLQHLRSRSLWIIRETDGRWIPGFPGSRKICLTVQWLCRVCLPHQQRLNCVDVFMTRTASSAAACRLFRTFSTSAVYKLIKLTYFVLFCRYILRAYCPFMKGQ